jgi:branched-chain amino acid transport system permease protein
MVTGVIFVICVLTFRRGIVGEIIGMAGQWQARRGPSAPHRSHLVDRG